MGNRTKELMSCADCGRGVSFTAISCPHCGSTQPDGGYVLSAREQRRFGIEQENDRTLFGMLVLFTGIGVFLGAAMLGSTLGAIVCAFIGMVIGAPAAFVINMCRFWLFRPKRR